MDDLMEVSQETVKGQQQIATDINEDPEKQKRSDSLQELKVGHLRSILEKVKNELTKEQKHRSLQKKDFELKHTIVLKECAEFKSRYMVERSLRLQKEEELKSLRKVKMTNEKLNSEMVTLNHRVQDLTGFKNFADKKMGEQSLALKSWEKQHIDLTEKIQKITAVSSEYKYQLDELNQVNQKFQAEKEKCRKQDNDIKRHLNQMEAYRSQIRENKMTTKELTTNLKDCTQSFMDLQDVVIKMRETEKNLLGDLDHQKREAEKQRQLIARMEDELNNLSNMKMKLQTKERDMTKQSLTKDEEVQYVRNLIRDSEGKQRLLMIETESLKDEKKNLQQHLFKTQEELDQKKVTTRKLREQVRNLNTEADNKNEMLAKANKTINSLKKQLKKGKLRLAELKKIYEELKKSTDFLMESIKLNEVLAEKAKLEKEVQRCNGMVEHQQMRLNLQEASTALLEKSIQESEDKVRFLMLENKRLKDEMYIKQSKQRQAKVFSGQDVHLRRKNQWFFKKNPLMSARNAEIAELRRRLARRPEDAIQKLQLCRWEKRLQSKQLKGVQGQLLAYQEMHHSVCEANKELTNTIKKMNLRMHLPPISKTSQPPTDDGSRDECKPVSKPTHFPTRAECKPVSKPTNFPTIKAECCLMASTFIPMFPPLPPPRSEHRLVSRQTRFPIIENGTAQ